MKFLISILLIAIFTIFSAQLSAKVKELPVHKEAIAIDDYFDSSFTYDFSSKIGINIKHTDIDEITFDEPLWPEDHFVELPGLEFIYNPYFNEGKIIYRDKGSELTIAEIADFTIVNLKQSLRADVVMDEGKKLINVYMGEALLFTKEIDKYDIFTSVDWNFEIKKPNDEIGIKLIHALYSEVILDETVEVHDYTIAIPELYYAYNPFYKNGEIKYLSEDMNFTCATIQKKKTLFGLLDYTDIQPLIDGECHLTVKTEPTCEKSTCVAIVSLAIIQ